MSEVRPIPCLDADTLAAFAEGKLPRHEIPAVLAHLEVCRTCMHALETANALREPEERRRAPWLAIAATVVLAVAGLPVARRFLVAPAGGTARLVALAPRTERIVEPRITGGFVWAPYRGPNRAPDAASDSGRLKLAGAAGELLDRAQKDSSADAQRTAGAALLLIEQPLDAAAKLRAAAERAPSAALWSDLGAAEYAAAVRLGRPSRYPEALAALDRALSLRAELPKRCSIASGTAARGDGRDALPRRSAASRARGDRRRSADGGRAGPPLSATGPHVR